MNDGSAKNQNNTQENDWQQVIIDNTSQLVKLETWRMNDGSNEATVLKNLEEIKKFFVNQMNDFNQTHKTQIRPFEWKGKDKVDGKEMDFWVFGFRAGNGPRKVSLICHLDTVPPGNNDWQPFAPRPENRMYKGVSTPFLIGRGAIDDKGPAVVAFESFTRALKQVSVDPDKVTLEVLFDTSEETEMSTPHYFDANLKEVPAFGIVFDAIWSVRAEKGIERPVFTINSKDVPDKGQTRGLTISQLSTPGGGAANMIPVTAEAHISGSKDELVKFAKNIDTMYRNCPFDDPDYHPAEISVVHNESEVVITAKVAGAQHGSAPHQNRANGANPLVSLTNFLAFLVDRDIITNNHHGEMCRFIRWTFGTRAFGESQPDLLYRFDSVFGEGNGTTYGLTQLFSKNPGEISLGIDIRYATGHHGKGWDGSEGKIAGDSLFPTAFQQLVTNYQSEAGGAKVAFTTKTAFGPDIRSTRDENLYRINMAYRSVMGENCPMQSIGGATDAHGRLELVTAGSLFTDNLGPPVNYHGIDEGAPLTDLENSGKILLNLLLQELGISAKHDSPPHAHHGHGCCI